MKGISVIAMEIDNYKTEIDRKGYESMYAVGKYCCERKKYVKSGFSKSDGRRYRFINNFIYIDLYNNNLKIMKTLKDMNIYGKK